MTSPESPSSLLERAADLIENLACGATAGPWRLNEAGHIVQSDGRPDRDRILMVGGRSMGLSEGNAGWSATLNPSVATPLVAWLRRAASYFGDGPLTDEQADADPYAGPAMQFARTVLGEETP